MTPIAIAKITVKIPTSVAIASETRSKHTTLSITPPAKLSRRLTVRLEPFWNKAPIRPPSPVPATPAIAVAAIKVAIVLVKTPPSVTDKCAL